MTHKSGVATCTREGCERRHYAHGVCVNHYRAARRAGGGGAERACVECGNRYRTTESRSTVCSRSCRARVAQRRTTAVRYPDRVTALCVRTIENTRAWQSKPTIVPTVGDGAWTAGTCRVCGDSFISRLRSITCSAACQAIVKADYWREKDHRRRAREREAYVAPVRKSEIARRDTYTCGLCHLPVDMSLVVPHAGAPTIDHIIPLAAGGTHEPGNVQLAHFLCNSTKGSRLTLTSVVA